MIRIFPFQPEAVIVPAGGTVAVIVIRHPARLPRIVVQRVVILTPIIEIKIVFRVIRVKDKIKIIRGIFEQKEWRGIA